MRDIKLKWIFTIDKCGLKEVSTTNCLTYEMKKLKQNENLKEISNWREIYRYIKGVEEDEIF